MDLTLEEIARKRHRQIARRDPQAVARELKIPVSLARLTIAWAKRAAQESERTPAERRAVTLTGLAAQLGYPLADDKALVAHLEKLPEHHREVYFHRLGLDDGDGRPRSAHETAERFGVTPARIWKIEQDCRDRLSTMRLGLPVGHSCGWIRVADPPSGRDDENGIEVLGLLRHSLKRLKGAGVVTVGDLRAWLALPKQEAFRRLRGGRVGVRNDAFERLKEWDGAETSGEG